MLKRKSTSSIPTPSSGDPHPPAKRLRQSSSTSALGSDDDLFGDSDGDSGSAAEQIPLVSQVPVRAQPTSLAKFVTESYPSPEPSGEEEEGVSQSHSRQTPSPSRQISGPLRSSSPRYPSTATGSQETSASAVDGPSTGQEHILSFLEGLLANGSVATEAEGNVDKSSHVGMDFEPMVPDRATSPPLLRPTSTSALVPAHVHAIGPADITIVGAPAEVADAQRSADDTRVAEPTSDVRPAVLSPPRIKSATIATLTDKPKVLSPGGEGPRPYTSLRSRLNPRRSQSAERSQPPSPVASAYSASGVGKQSVSAPTTNVETDETFHPDHSASSPAQPAVPQATPSGASHPPTQSTGGPAPATQESTTPTRVMSPAGSFDPSEPSHQVVTSPSPMSSIRSAEQTNLVFVGMPAKMQSDDSHQRPDTASTCSAASVLVQATPSPQRQSVLPLTGQRSPSLTQSGQQGTLGPTRSCASSHHAARPARKSLASREPDCSSSSQTGKNSSGKQESSADSAMPVVIGTGLRRTPPPPAPVHSSQSSGNHLSQPAARPRIIPKGMSPHFYFRTSVQSLLKFDDPPYGRLRKLAFRVELLLEWRPLLIAKIERLLGGQSKAGALNKDFKVVFTKLLSELKEDALIDTVDYTRDWVRLLTHLCTDYPAR